MGRRVVSMDEVARHDRAGDCWVVLCGVVYDLTDFHRTHPGGSAVILDNAGKEASAPFLAVHPSDIGERMLPASAIVGEVDPATVKPHHVAPAPGEAVAGPEAQLSGTPELREMLSTYDFEAVARATMSKQGWAYYSTGADDEITLRENHNAFSRIWLKPRILVNVKKVDTRSQILGYDCALPLYISATALGRLAHPDGEKAFTRASAAEGVIQMLPTLSSCTLDEMLDARAPGQIVMSQLYVNEDRERTADYVRKLEAAGVKALFITVDAPCMGRREKDQRNKFLQAGTHMQQDDDNAGIVDRNKGVSRAISTFIDPSLCWEDLAFFFELTSMPIILKGVQCAEDAVLALRYGCAGVVLSNHGGRQLDTARSGIEILPEVMAALRKEPGYSKQHFQVFVDGGVRRGADIFKALALGATAVGIGRPSIYALAAFGPEGVERMLQIFKEEFEMVMRLMGTTDVYSITEDHVLTRNLADHFATQPRDNLLNDTYEPLRTAMAMRQDKAKL